MMSSKAVPGNEVNVAETMNRLYRMGATVLTENNAYVHVSGHGSADELRTMLELVRPQILRAGARRVPDAARARRDRRARPAWRRTPCGSPTTAPCSSWTATGCSWPGQIEAGMTLVDGYSVGDMREEVLRDRRRLATDGVLIVVATIAADSAEVVADPEVIARGFETPDDDGQELLDAARDAADEVLERCLATAG